MKTQSHIKTKLWIFTLSFIVLLSVSMPLKYNILCVNNYIISFFEYITKFCACILSLNENLYTLKLFSDSTGLYIHVVFVFILSIILSFLLYPLVLKYSFFKPEKIKQFIWSYSSYYLSLQMLIYGFNKVFKWQFYDAHPNTAYTPLGFLTKDFLYWTSMGSSYMYSLIIGLLEVGIGILLLFKRTRFFAACLGFLAVLHIVLINFSFDINVKIQSLFLLLLMIIVLSPNIKPLYSVFFNIKVDTITIYKPIFNIKRNIYNLLKTILILLLFTEALYPYFKANNFNGDLSIKPPFYGAYTIKNDVRYKRFFIHSDPYFIIQDKNDKLFSFFMEYNIDSFKIKHEDKTSILKLTNDSINNILKLEGNFFGYPLNTIVEPIDLSKMPIYEDSFHWTIDSYK